MTRQQRRAIERAAKKNGASIQYTAGGGMVIGPAQRSEAQIDFACDVVKRWIDGSASILDMEQEMVSFNQATNGPEFLNVMGVIECAYDNGVNEAMTDMTHPRMKALIEHLMSYKAYMNG